MVSKNRFCAFDIVVFSHRLHPWPRNGYPVENPHLAYAILIGLPRNTYPTLRLLPLKILPLNLLVELTNVGTT